MEYGYHGLDQSLIPVECDKSSIVTFLTKYNDKRESILSVKVASVSQTRSTKWQKISTNQGTFNGNVELKKYTMEEND